MRALFRTVVALLSALIAAYTGAAQYRGEYFEKPFLRISPQWVEAIENAGYDGWSINDGAADAAGNSYSAGAFSTGIYIGDSLRYPGGHPQEERFYLTSRNKTGGLNWIGTAKGFSRPVALTLATNGDIVVTGMMYRECTFYGASPADSLRLTSRYSNLAAYFIRYSAAGRIVKGAVYAREAGVELNGLSNCGKSGFVAAGNTSFHPASDPSTANRQMIVLRFDENFNVTLEKRSTPFYNDIGASAAADEAGNIYFAANCWDGFQLEHISLPRRYTGSVIGKMDKDGKLLWTRSMPDAQVSHVFVSGKAELSLAGSFGGYLIFCSAADTPCKTVTERYVLPSRNRCVFAAKLDLSGQVRWTAHGESYSECTIKGACIDNKGGIYLAVSCSGSSFYSRGNTDSLQLNDNATVCLKYTRDGRLAWMKAFNKYSHSDFRIGIAVDPSENVIISGQYAPSEKPRISIGDSTRTLKRGRKLIYSFAFDKASLEDRSKRGKVVLPASLAPKEIPWTADCRCTATPDPEEPRNAFPDNFTFPVLEDVYEPGRWEALTGMRLPSGKRPRPVFYDKFFAQTTSDGADQSFELLSKEEIVLEEEGGNFSLGITPCTTDGIYVASVSTIDGSGWREHEEGRGYTHRRVYEAVLEAFKTSDEDLLEHAVTALGKDSLLRRLSSRYHLSIPRQRSKADSGNFAGLVDAVLQKAGLKTRDAVYELVLAPSLTTDTGWSDGTLSLLTKLVGSKDELNPREIWALITPGSFAHYEGLKHRFLFPGGLLYAADSEGKARVENGGKVPFSFLISDKLKRLDYSTGRGFALRPETWCIPDFTLGNTGIVVPAPEKFEPMLAPYQEPGDYFNFLDISELLRGRDFLPMAGAPRRAHFLGFSQPNGLIRVPYEAKRLELPARYAFSDRLFAAEVRLPYARNDEGVIYLELGKDSLLLTELLSGLRKGGIDAIAYAPEHFGEIAPAPQYFPLSAPAKSETIPAYGTMIIDFAYGKAAEGLRINPARRAAPRRPFPQ